LENANRFLIAGSYTCAANSGFASAFVKQTTPLTYVLDNVRLNYDVAQTSDAYTSSLRSYLASNQLTLPVDTYYTTQFDIQSTQNGWVNFTVSTQMSDISSVYVAFLKSDEQSSYAFASTDRFIKPTGLSEARLQINGKPYPNVNMRLSGNQNLPEAECYQYLMKALRQNCSLEVIGNSNHFKESRRILKINSVSANRGLAPAAAGAAYVQAEVNAIRATSVDTGYKDVITPTGLYYGVMKSTPPADNATIAAPANTNLFYDESILLDTPSSFVIGVDISKSTYSNEYELSGQDLTKSSGLIQVNLRFDQQPGVNLQALVIVKHKRILDIGLDSSQVIY
jgi:hypothetical protein